MKSLRRKVRKLANASDALRKRSWMVSSKGPEGGAEEEPLLVEDKIMFIAVERCIDTFTGRSIFTH